MNTGAKTTFRCTGCGMGDWTTKWPPQMPRGWTYDRFIDSSGDKGVGLFHSKKCHLAFKGRQGRDLRWCENYDHIKEQLAKLKTAKATLKKVEIVEGLVKFSFTKGWEFWADIGKASIHQQVLGTP